MGRVKEITQDTLVPLGLVITIIGGAASWGAATNRLETLEKRQERYESAAIEVNKKLDKVLIQGAENETLLRYLANQKRGR